LHDLSIRGTNPGLLYDRGISVTLREWLESAEKSVAWLASELGVRHQAVYAWMHGRYAPRGARLERIEKLSGGLVTAATLCRRASNA